MFDIELNAGLVFGLNVDRIYMVESEDDEPDFDKPSTVIYLHLGPLTLAVMF